MVTQEFISNLWTLVPAYKNEAVFQSHAPTSTPRASTTLTPQPSNPAISKGEYFLLANHTIATMPAKIPTIPKIAL